LKKARDPVFAATINQTGGLEVRVTKLAKDSTIEKLIRTAEEAQSEKAETQRASALGFSLPLTVGVAGHEGSKVLVCLNGLRLLTFRAKIGS